MLQSFMPPNLKRVDELVLRVLLKTSNPQTAREIRKRLRTEDPNEKDFLYGSIYSSLARLEQYGLINSSVFLTNHQNEEQKTSVFQCTQNGKRLIENKTAATGYR